MIEGEDGGLRLTLNGAENRKTLAGHFIAESFGSSVQHLAFACGDIFATAGRMADLGFEALEISQNYYDDLEARLGLDPELTERLRAVEHPLRPGRRRRVLPALQPQLRRGLLLRDRRASGRVQGLRRTERPLPHRRPKAQHQAARDAKGLRRTATSRRRQCAISASMPSFYLGTTRHWRTSVLNQQSKCLLCGMTTAMRILVADTPIEPSKDWTGCRKRALRM